MSDTPLRCQTLAPSDVEIFRPLPTPFDVVMKIQVINFRAIIVSQIRLIAEIFEVEVGCIGVGL